MIPIRLDIQLHVLIEVELDEYMVCDALPGDYLDEAIGFANDGLSMMPDIFRFEVRESSKECLTQAPGALSRCRGRQASNGCLLQFGRQL
eukprot:12414585-Karenia_brevis.AAC.1